MIRPSSPKAGLAPKQSPHETERRVSARFPFSAVAKLVDVVSHIRITARVSDISNSGCYLDVINVFGPGTKAQLAIRHANLQFEALATVVYSLAGMGTDVAFNASNPEMTAILDSWIAELKGEIAPINSPTAVNRMIQNFPRVERHILGRLIGLMMRETMLTREEGTDLLDELLRDSKE